MLPEPDEAWTCCDSLIVSWLEWWVVRELGRVPGFRDQFGTVKQANDAIT